MSEVLGIYGASGFGREVMPIAEQAFKGRLVFVDDGTKSKSLNGFEVVSFDEFMHLQENEKYISIAIADGSIRERLTNKCEEHGIEVLSLISASAEVQHEVLLGSGSILCSNTVITSNAKIGKSFHANLFSYVAHDCVIGDYVTFAPAVRCNGNVHIEDYAYIGTGAILKQGTNDRPLVIGKGAIVGMGAVVTKDVAPGTVVIGNPARPLEKR